jgi:hypothetical protein
MDSLAVGVVWSSSLGLALTALEFGKQALRSKQNGREHQEQVAWQAKVTGCLEHIEDHTKNAADRLENVQRMLDQQSSAVKAMAKALNGHCEEAEKHHDEAHDFMLRNEQSRNRGD